jgi:hypothetical protein
MNYKYPKKETYGTEENKQEKKRRTHGARDGKEGREGESSGSDARRAQFYRKKGKSG